MANDRPLLLDVTRLIWRRWVGRLPTGIDRVCLAYLDRYRHDSQAVIQRRGFRRILPAAASDQLFDILSGSGPGLRSGLMEILGREGLARLRPLPGRGRLYLNVGHTALDQESYLDWSRAAGVRPVYMIHDLIPITHPEYCRAGEAQRHVRRVGHMLANAAGIIGNSRDTLDRLDEFAADRRVPTPPMIAAPLGSHVRRASRATTVSSSRPAFVVLGTIEARKNHLMLLQLWLRMIRSLGPEAPRLTIIGQRGWECEQVFDLLDRSELLREAVVETGRCSDAELERHLATARALLFPSMVEGYGLPLVEAMSAGTPVIASDIPVFHEVGQGVPDFLDPLDGPAWEQLILSYAREDSPEREAQVARLAAYRAPSWSDHFDRVDAWLGTL